MLCDHCVRLCVVFFIGCLVISALLMYFVMWIWDCTYLSSLCVGDLMRLVLGGVRFAGCKTSTTQNQPHQNSNTQRTENKTTDVVNQQHSRKLPMMDILMSETCWAHNKWKKIASDIKVVFHSSTSFKFLKLLRPSLAFPGKVLKDVFWLLISERAQIPVCRV